MGRGRNVVKVKKMTTTNKEDADVLNTMFEQMTGVSNADADVIIPKIIKLHNRVIKFKKLFSIVLSLKEFVELFAEYNWFDEIRVFLDNLIISTETDEKITYDDTNIAHILSYKKIDEAVLNEQYKALKNDVNIKQIVITGGNLMPFKKHLEDVNNLDGSFINREPGIILEPFSFSKLDLKIVWNDEHLSQQGKKLILSMLHHAYKIGIDVYDTVTSPDIDITKFSSILVENISNLRKQIPRCDKAFDIIENSVKLLESNFKDYYKSSVQAENPSIIMESFIIDVSTSQNASPVVTMQFKKIVEFLKKRSANITDPKMKKIFGMLNNQFDNIDAQLHTNSKSNDVENTNDA